MELKRQAVCDLPVVMSDVDALVDYTFNKSSGDHEKRKSNEKGKDKQKKDGKKNKDKQKDGKRVLPLNKEMNCPS